MLQICPGAVGYGELEQLLATEQIDAVHVCSPPSAHFPIARAVLNAGCHAYVEKPFAETSAEARDLVDLAKARDLTLCAGHQLLFEAPARRALDLVPSLGRIVHVESYFAFRPVRRGRGGGPAMSTELQLLDVLPHPVYLLLAFLRSAASGAAASLTALDVGRSGTVHGLVSCGEITGSLVVTLEGRPVESFIRLVGSNGTVHADFVRGTVQRLIGPGSSGIDKALNPFRLARQLGTDTAGALGRRVLKRQRSYPGLAEIFSSFYDSIERAGPPAMSGEDIVETVEVCEQIALAVHEDDGPTVEAPLGPDAVAITGGTGFLGTALARVLAEDGVSVRAIARRKPAPWERVSGVSYCEADLGSGTDPATLAGCGTIVHCAAETAGGWPEHQRNSVDATENLMRAAAAAGVRQVIHVSSLAVLAPPPKQPIGEETPLLSDSRSRGPYVWGKAESEELVRRLGAELGIQVKVVRPGALVDFDDFEPPGRLGRRLGNAFVAVGSPRDMLGTTSLEMCAEAIAWISRNFDLAPDTINLLDPQLPSKRSLVDRLKARNPDLRVIWMPRPVLHPLSWLGLGLQRVLRPGRPPINVARVFAQEAYDTSATTRLMEQVRERSLVASASAAGQRDH